MSNIKYHQPRNLQSLVFSKIIHHAEHASALTEGYILPEYNVNYLWFDYLNSHVVTSAGLLKYVEKTRDLEGALRCLLKHNPYCPINEEFEWNIKSDAYFCDDNADFAIDEFYRLLERKTSCLTKYNMFKLIVLYMYISSTHQMFLPLEIILVHYDACEVCFECNASRPDYYRVGHYENDEVTYIFNKLIIDTNYRCVECGNFLFDIHQNLESLIGA